MAEKSRKLTRKELAEALAKAMNLLNDLDRDEWDDKQLGDWHELGAMMPQSVDYWNNGTVFGRDL